MSDINYPTQRQLVQSLALKPSLDGQYWVRNLSLLYIVILLIKDELTIDFSPLREPQFNYDKQTELDQHMIDIAGALLIYYGCDPGQVVRWLNGEYTGAKRDITQILCSVKPYISDSDFEHIGGF